MSPARRRLGTQGWNGPAWVGPFYPQFRERSLRWTRPGIGADAAGASRAADGGPAVDRGSALALLTRRASADILHL